MSIEAKSLLAQFLDGETIEDVFDHGKPAPDHATSRRVDASKPKLSIQSRFEEFHAGNPIIYELFCEYARQAKARGYDRIGIQFIAERIRWRINIESGDQHSKFKINQDYLSRYSRLIEEQEPDLKGFFTKRTLVTR